MSTYYNGKEIKQYRMLSAYSLLREDDLVKLRSVWMNAGSLAGLCVGDILKVNKLFKAKRKV